MEGVKGDALLSSTEEAIKAYIANDPLYANAQAMLDMLKKIQNLCCARTISPGFCIPHIEDFAAEFIAKGFQPHPCENLR